MLSDCIYIYSIRYSIYYFDSVDLSKILLNKSLFIVEAATPLKAFEEIRCKLKEILRLARFNAQRKGAEMLNPDSLSLDIDLIDFQGTELSCNNDWD